MNLNGYAMVPVEPTEQMVNAGVRVATSQRGEPWCPPCYRAMIAAAPRVGEPVAWMRRTVTYAAGDERTEGERVVSERKVYEDDIPLYAPTEAV